MLRLLLSKAQGCKVFLKPFKPCHVGIHWIALAEHSQMSTHVPGLHTFFRFSTSFFIGQISIRAKVSYRKSNIHIVSYHKKFKKTNPYMQLPIILESTVRAGMI